MKKGVLPMLMCPECRSDLEVTVDREESEEIRTGILTCNSCKRNYPIVEGIPNFITEHPLRLD